MADNNTFGGAPVENSSQFNPYTKEDFMSGDAGKQYLDQNRHLNKGAFDYFPDDRTNAWNDYKKKGSTWNGGGSTTSSGASDLNSATDIVVGNPQKDGEINVSNAASDLVKDPGIILDGDRSLQEESQGSVMTGNEQGTTVDGTDEKYQMDAGGLNQEAVQGEAEQANPVDPRESETYEVDKVEDKVRDEVLEGAKGELSEDAQINAPEIDVEAIAKGEDGNGVGEALKEYASQDFDDVDKRATAKGQLEQLQDDFVDPVTGEPRIPNWAAATARSTSKIIAFTGKSGSAATAAMAQAIMEASIPVAMEDAKFFQTLTMENLSNEQESIINRANVLSKFELANQDSRVTAAVENAKNFLAMDLANLSNEQQAAVINNQNRINAMFEDAKQENTKRLFEAQSQNDLNKFYDQLNSQVDQFNKAQSNNMTQFNAGQVNDMSKFNASLENSREEFYKNMQFQIDTANAKWRQTVTLQEDAQNFEAAAQDVKNKIGLTTEMLNRLWDRSDNLLQFAWQSGENADERAARLAIAELQAKAGKQSSSSAWGNIAGGLLTSETFWKGAGSVVGSLF